MLSIRAKNVFFCIHYTVTILNTFFLTQRQAASQRTVTQQAIWVGKLVWQIITSIGSDFFIRYGNLIFTLSIYKDQSPSIQTQY